MGLKTNQIKSKERVADFGEVFTSEREISAMCDLVKGETERIESRFLEPACGNGNFLAEVLRRKLNVVNKRYGKSQLDYEKYSFIAVASIYGVELLLDNVAECRWRLFLIWKKNFEQQFGEGSAIETEGIINYVLMKNILCGDALTLLDSKKKPLIFSEWSFVQGTKVKRREFELSVLMDTEKAQMDMFTTEWSEELQCRVPLPIKVYPLTDFKRIAEDG